MAFAFPPLGIGSTSNARVSSATGRVGFDQGAGGGLATPANIALFAAKAGVNQMPKAMRETSKLLSHKGTVTTAPTGNNLLNAFLSSRTVAALPTLTQAPVARLQNGSLARSPFAAMISQASSNFAASQKSMMGGLMGAINMMEAATVGDEQALKGHDAAAKTESKLSSIQ